MKSYKLTGKRDCLIISIGIYDDTKNRENFQKDADLLDLTFEKIGFNCTILTGRVTLDQIEHQIRLIIRGGKQRSKDMIAVCILAHGSDNKTVQLSDGQTIHVHNLLKVGWFN